MRFFCGAGRSGAAERQSDSVGRIRATSPDPALHQEKPAQPFRANYHRSLASTLPRQFTTRKDRTKPSFCALNEEAPAAAVLAGLDEFVAARPAERLKVLGRSGVRGHDLEDTPRRQARQRFFGLQDRDRAGKAAGVQRAVCPLSCRSGAAHDGFWVGGLDPHP